MTYILLFIIGLVFGSFGSVLLGRLGKHSLHDIRANTQARRHDLHSVLFWRSFCPHCHHTLGAQNLIPIVSYVSTKGKCRYCHANISVRYLILEIGCGLLFAYLGYILLAQDVSPLHILLRFASSRAMYLLIIYDIQTMYLHELLWAFSALFTIGIVATAPSIARYGGIQRAIITFIFFLAIYRLGKWYVRLRRRAKEEWFGSGDVRLAPIIGAQFWLIQHRVKPLPDMLTSREYFRRYIIIAGIIWLAYAGMLKLIKPKSSVHHIPFFPGMITAIWVLMLILA